MTAYGAAISLRNTINYILHSSHFSLVELSPHILQLAYYQLRPLQDILEGLDRTRTSKSRKKVNALEGRIKDLIWEFQNLLESLLYQQILGIPSQSRADQVDEEMKERVWEFGGLLESLHSQPQILFQSPRLHHTTPTTRRRRIRAQIVFTPIATKIVLPQIVFQRLPPHHTTTRGRRRRRLMVHKEKGRKFNTPRIMNGVEGERIRFSIDLQFLQHHVRSFIQRLKDMEKEYIYEVYNMPEDDDVDQSISSRSGTKSKMIGLSDEFQQLKKELMESRCFNDYIALVGTAGVGKTALAEAVFEDPEILSHFEHRVWVRVGRKSQFDDVSRGILAQMCEITQGDHELGAYLEERLEGKKNVLDGVWEGKKCLIVLDDVWERQILDSLTRSFENINDGLIKILVTTRDKNVYCSKHGPTHTILVRFLKEEESKELLCEKVFGEKDCPFHLDKAITKIAKNCEGLPLMIVTVADILSKAQDTDPKYWDDVAEKRNSVFTDAYNEISKVLFPSYDYLPQYLKMPFLYMGVFPPEYNIPLSKIMNMLACEGWFHNINKKESLEDSIFKCLDQLCNYRYLALFNERNIYNSWWEFGNRKFKTCWLHSSWRYVCRGEARKNKFYHVLNKLDEDLEDNVKGQHCLCLENNILFSIKDFCISMRLNCASSARSLLFFGPYHQYPIPLGDDFKLLGKLDALNLRLYTFPTEILTLVLLKYLALTCNGELPTTISKLFNLRVLIIHPHSNIRICRAPSNVPIEIWDMQVLEHIEILGKSLVAPCHYTSLEKLSTLIGVNASISTILELSHKVPCIRKLGVQIELTPYDEHDDLLSCFGCVSTLGSLETLKCSIINPVVKYDHAFPSSLMLPRWLKKLHLSGMGFSWEYMDVIGSLHSLEVLKLRAYAFRGSKWETQLRSFLKLRFLLIEDSDLVQWKPRYGSFPNLVRLSLKHCYKLEEIHWPSHYMLGTIEVVNCNPVALTCAKKLRPDPETSIDVTASFSFDEKPVTIKFERHGYKRWIKRKDGMPCSPIPLSRCITDNKNAAGFSGVHAVGTSSVHAADVYEKGSFDEEGSFDATESDFDEEDSVDATESDLDEEDSVDATESDFDEEDSVDATESDNDVGDEDAQDVPEAVDEADE